MCVCSLVSSLGLPLLRALSLSLSRAQLHTHTNTHSLVSLATLPRRLLPPTPSRLRGRQGKPTAARSSGGAGRRDQGEGSADGGHQSADTPKSFSVLAEVYPNVRYFLFYIWRIAQDYMGRLSLNPSKIVSVCKMTCYFLSAYLYSNSAPFTTLIHLNR